MPLYSVSTPNRLSDATNEALANLITNTHCEITAAPKLFVNVVFHNYVPLKKGIVINIMANVRQGRTAEMSEMLQQSLITKISELMGIEKSVIELSLFEVPARWIMEGGEIMPEPGEEGQPA